MPHDHHETYTSCFHRGSRRPIRRHHSPIKGSLRQVTARIERGAYQIEVVRRRVDELESFLCYLPRVIRRDPDPADVAVRYRMLGA